MESATIREGCAKRRGKERTLPPGRVETDGWVVGPENMTRALRRVQVNKGAQGVDGITVDELPPNLHKERPRIKEELLNGTYKPASVRTVEILKPEG